MIALVWNFGLALSLAAFLTGRYRVYALQARIIDIPNARSSHVVPTPRGGGLAIVVVITLQLLWLALVEPNWREVGLAAAIAGIAVAVVGFLDDRSGVPASHRFAVHVVAVALMLFGTRSLGPLELPGLPPFAWMHAVAAAISLLWLLNLFNFVDGIDGIAAAEAAFVSLALAACLLLTADASQGTLAACLVTAGGALGFLWYNWPPAKIFMGDVGSGFLGFMLGVLAVVGHRETGLSPWVAAILLGTFVTDATITLLRRALRGEKWHQAHRAHAYQWLSRRFGSHRPVTLAFVGINIAWLLPLALLATIRPDWAALVCLLAYAPLVALALWSGAGRPESIA